jgi:hypothetical protein
MEIETYLQTKFSEETNMERVNTRIFMLIFNLFLVGTIHLLLSKSTEYTLTGIRVQMFLVLAVGTELVLPPAGFVMN